MEKNKHKKKREYFDWFALFIEILLYLPRLIIGIIKWLFHLIT